MKCKACNVVLLDDELKMLGEEMELCSDCLDGSDSSLYDNGGDFEHDYQFDDDLTLLIEGYNEDGDY